MPKEDTLCGSASNGNLIKTLRTALLMVCRHSSSTKDYTQFVCDLSDNPRR